jgi:hypothetical protein
VRACNYGSGNGRGCEEYYKIKRKKNETGRKILCNSRNHYFTPYMYYPLVLSGTNRGESVSIEAIPDENWIFTAWSVITGICGFDDSYAAHTSVTLMSDVTILATFIDTEAPRGYSVNIDQPNIDDDNGQSSGSAYIIR